MSDSSSALLAAASAAASTSGGTRWNSRPDASQIHDSSSSKGLSSSCTLYRLRGGPDNHTLTHPACALPCLHRPCGATLHRLVDRQSCAW